MATDPLPVGAATVAPRTAATDVINGTNDTVAINPPEGTREANDESVATSTMRSERADTAFVFGEPRVESFTIPASSANTIPAESAASAGRNVRVTVRTNNTNRGPITPTYNEASAASHPHCSSPVRRIHGSLILYAHPYRPQGSGGAGFGRFATADEDAPGNPSGTYRAYSTRDVSRTREVSYNTRFERVEVGGTPAGCTTEIFMDISAAIDPGYYAAYGPDYPSH